MSRLEHPVSQEELMAFVDGQLDEASQVSKVAEHLEVCQECAFVVNDAKRLSGQLAAWKVEDLPERVGENVLGEQPRNSAPQSVWWTGVRVWACALSGGIVVAMLLLFAAAPLLWPPRATMPMPAREPAQEVQLLRLHSR
jgi:anti-sigma factor RsiW